MTQLQMRSPHQLRWAILGAFLAMLGILGGVACASPVTDAWTQSEQAQAAKDKAQDDATAAVDLKVNALTARISALEAALAKAQSDNTAALKLVTDRVTALELAVKTLQAAQPPPVPAPVPAPTPAPAPSYTISVTAPAPGATVSGNVDIKGKGDGFAGGNVELFGPDGAVLGQMTPTATGLFSLALDTTRLPNGSQTVTLRAWDGATPGGAFTHAAPPVTLQLNVANALSAPVPSPAGYVKPPIPANALLASSYGVKCDGTTNDQNALQAALSAGKAQGKPVAITQSGSCLHSDVIRVDSVALYCAGPTTATLKATNPDRGAVFLVGNNPAFVNCKTDGVGGPLSNRGDKPAQNGVTIGGEGIAADRATNPRVENVWVFNPKAAGFFNWNSSGGLITHNLCDSSLADCFHNWGALNDLKITYNKARNGGDDGVALVSSGANMSVNVEIAFNDIEHNRWARCYTVAGGRGIMLHDNYGEDCAEHAALYIASGEWGTGSVLGIEAWNNTFVDCGGTSQRLPSGAQGTSQGCITIYNANLDAAAVIQGFLLRDNLVARQRNATVLIAGQKITGEIRGTRIYADPSRALWQGPSTGITQANNGPFQPVANYPGPIAPVSTAGIAP